MSDDLSHPWNLPALPPFHWDCSHQNHFWSYSWKSNRCTPFPILCLCGTYIVEPPSWDCLSEASLSPILVGSLLVSFMDWLFFFFIALYYSLVFSRLSLSIVGSPISNFLSHHLQHLCSLISVHWASDLFIYLPSRCLQHLLEHSEASSA